MPRWSLTLSFWIAEWKKMKKKKGRKSAKPPTHHDVIQKNSILNFAKLTNIATTIHTYIKILN